MSTEALLKENDELTEKFGTLYNPKIEAVLKEVQAEALRRGFIAGSPYEMTDEEYRWSMLIKPADLADTSNVGVDVIITVPESYVNGGADPESGDRNGVNFSLDLVEYGGLMVGGCTPYNYTPQCWVPLNSPEAVASRWGVFTDAFDATSVVDEIEQYYAQQAA